MASPTHSTTWASGTTQAYAQHPLDYDRVVGDERGVDDVETWVREAT